MSCPAEPQLALHADLELPSEEARRIEAHLAACARCRQHVEALRAEGRLLARILEEGAVAEPARQAASWGELIATGAVLVAVAAGVQAAWRWLGSLGEQATLGLVDTRSLVWSAGFESFFFLLREGASMLNSLLTVLGLLAAALALAALGHALRRRRLPGALLLAAVGALWATEAAAFVRRAPQNGSVTVAAGETIDDTLFATGETVTVDGVVTGNLLAFARRVYVKGTVKGDLIAAGHRVEVSGTVEGNVFVGSEETSLRGRVLRGVHAFTQRVTVAPEARVEGDAMAFAQSADLEGGFGRDVLVFAGHTTLRGDVARNAWARTDQLDVEAPARVGGNLTAHVDQPGNVTIAPDATVVGTVDTRLPEAEGRRGRYSRPGFYVWKAVWLAAAFVTGLVLWRLWPSLFAFGPTSLGALARPLGIGALVLVAAPVAIVVVGLTIVGLPLALLALAAFLSGLYVGGVVTGALIGSLLLARRGAAPRFAVALIVGLFAMAVATSVPYLGGLVRLVALPLGLGIAALQVRRRWRPAPGA